MKFVVDLHRFRYATGTQQGTQTAPKKYRGGGGGVLVFEVNFP